MTPSDKKAQAVAVPAIESPQIVILMVDDDVYEKPTRKRYDEACKKAFGERVKLVQFYSADEAFDYLISNKVHVIISSIVEYASIEDYYSHLGGGDIFIKVCKSLYKEVPFIVWASSDNDKAVFFKYNTPDGYMSKETGLAELFSKIETLSDQRISTEETNYKIEHEDIDTLTELGLSYLLLSQYEKSTHIFHKIIEADSNIISGYYYQILAYYYLGVSCFALGYYHDALNHLQTAIKKLPNFKWAHYYLSETFLNLNMYEEAMKAAQLTIKLIPKRHSCYLVLGKAYQGMGMNGEAVQSFTQAAKLRPDLLSSWLSLAEIYSILGKNKEAIDAFKQVLRINPHYVDAHNKLTKLLTNEIL